MAIDELFEYSNQRARAAAGNEELLKGFFKTAAACRHFTVANQLLIQGYCEWMGLEPRDVRTAEEWAKNGITVNAGAAPVYVMEYDPKQPKKYRPKEVYDIQQTNASLTETNYDKGFLTEAIMLAAPCPLEYRDVLKIKGTKAYYMPDEKKTAVTKGFMDFDEIFSELAKEYAHYFIHAELGREKNGETNSADAQIRGVKPVYPRAVYADAAYGAAYIVCAANKMDTSHFRFANTFTQLGGEKASEIKKALGRAVAPAYAVLDNLDTQIMRLQAFNEKEAAVSAR